MKTIQDFKIRASASGQIMTNPRVKTELLSETTKTYVFDWLKENIYGYRKELNNKYVTKGLELEDEAIDKAIELLDLPFTLKNEQFYENEYFTGTPDLIIKDTVYDIKCSWSAFTFPLFEEKIPNINYKYQVNVYMHLLGLKKAKVIYVLLNTPDSLLNWEEKHNYDDLDKKFRIKVYEFEYDEMIINDLKERVENIRSFIKELKY